MLVLLKALKSHRETLVALSDPPHQRQSLQCLVDRQPFAGSCLWLHF